MLLHRFHYHSLLTYNIKYINYKLSQCLRSYDLMALYKCVYYYYYYYCYYYRHHHHYHYCYYIGIVLKVSFNLNHPFVPGADGVSGSAPAAARCSD